MELHHSTKSELTNLFLDKDLVGFLLNYAGFSVKTGVKNSYAPRVPLSGIFERTRNLAML
jgi:hypothetical protein